MPADRAAKRMQDNVWTGLSWQERTLIGLCILASLGITYTLSTYLRWPVTPAYQASLLSTPSIFMALLVTLLAMVASTALSTLIVHEVEFEAGFLCAAAGLGVLAVRGGTVGALLRTTNAPAGVYSTMAFETILLGAILAAAWVLLRQAQRRGLLAEELSAVPTEISASTNTKLLALVVTVAVTIVGVTILSQTDAKKQVLWSVGIASCVGALVGHQSMPVRPSPWYWSAPLIVGFIGYVWGLLAPNNSSIGVPANALAAASPLDYASAGVVGAILGYWVSRRWHANKGLEE